MGARLNLIKTVALWMLLWLSGGVIFNLILEPLGLNAYNNYYFAALYFVAFSLLGITLYKVKNLLPHHDPLLRQIVLMSAFTMLILFLAHLLNEYQPLSETLTKKILDNKIYFPLFLYRTWVVKLNDIIFQQIYIFILLQQLLKMDLTRKQIIYIFSAAFAALHLPLIVIFQWRAFYFILPSIFAGFIFSYVILHRKNGLFLSYAVHLGFYLILGYFMRQPNWVLA